MVVILALLAYPVLVLWGLVKARRAVSRAQDLFARHVEAKAAGAIDGDDYDHAEIDIYRAEERLGPLLFFFLTLFCLFVRLLCVHANCRPDVLPHQSFDFFLGSLLASVPMQSPALAPGRC